jgi:RNA polymerase sigma-70 factor (ECF subfamily)
VSTCTEVSLARDTVSASIRRESGRAESQSRLLARPRRLDPNRLSDHVDAMYRAAWALCGSPHDAEDLVQETFLNVLKRPRMIQNGNELGYLLRALRNTYATHYRSAARRPTTRELFDNDAPPQHESEISSRELMEAIATAPAAYRDAVIAVDVIGLSYAEAARALRTREATITSRLHRGRQHVARELRGAASTGG